MATSNTGVYDYGRQQFLSKTIDLTTDTIKARLVSSGYTPNLATDQFLSTVGAGIGSDQTVSGPTVTGGVFNCSALTWTAVASGTVAAVVFYKDTGSAATSPLIYYYDGTFTVTCAVAVVSTNTAMAVDPLPQAVASGAAFSIGGQTITTSAGAALGARSLAITSAPGSVAQGSTGSCIISGAGLPLVANGGNITFTPDSGANHIFKI